MLCCVCLRFLVVLLCLLLTYPDSVKPPPVSTETLKSFCKITSAPARYFDPVTQSAFSSVESFVELRKKAAK